MLCSQQSADAPGYVCVNPLRTPLERHVVDLEQTGRPGPNWEFGKLNTHLD